MKFGLLILGLVALFTGAGVLGFAESALHEVEAFVLFLIASVFICGFAVVQAVDRLATALRNP